MGKRTVAGVTFSSPWFDAVTEELARKAVKACHSEPISVYIPDERQLVHQPCKHGLYNCDQCDEEEELA